MRPFRASTVRSVGAPAGTMTQATRGGSRCPTSSTRRSSDLAPFWLTESRASGDRSNATTSWPFSRRRTVMLAPIFPSPTMPIFIPAPFLTLSFQPDRAPVRKAVGPPPPVDRWRARRRCGADSGDVRERVHRHPEHAALVRFQAAVVADRLGGDERAEVVPETGDRHLRRRAGRHDLDGDDGIGPAIVELAGGVQEARAVSGGA